MFIDIVVFIVLYKAVTGVKSYEKCLIEDNSGLDCIVVIEDDI